MKTASGSGFNTDCEVCGEQSYGLIDFQMVEYVKITGNNSTPVLSIPVEMCYPCFKLAAKLYKQMSG